MPCRSTILPFIAAAIAAGIGLEVAPAGAQAPAMEEPAGDDRPAPEGDVRNYADPEEIRAAARKGARRRAPRAASRGIEPPNAPEDAIATQPAGGQQLSLVVRSPEGRTRVVGRDRLTLQLGPVAGGPGDAALDLDITAEPFEHTHSVSGRFRFQYPVRLLINADDSPLWPWKAEYSQVNQTAAVSHALVILTDECGHWIQRETNEDGSFSFDWMPVLCDVGEVTVYSVSDDDRVGVGRWNNGPIETAAELTSLTPDYRAYAFTRAFSIDDSEGGLDLGTITVPVADDAARGFLIMDAVQRARAYHDSLPGVASSEMPKINVEHTEGLKPAGMACGANDAGIPQWDDLLRFAFFSPGIDPSFIHIPWECNDLGFDGHAHVHETVHYFHRLFLRQDPDYGRFGEGMANLQAALINGQSWMTTAGGQLLESLDINARMACFENGGWDSRIDGLKHDAFTRKRSRR